MEISMDPEDLAEFTASRITKKKNILETFVVEIETVNL